MLKDSEQFVDRLERLFCDHAEGDVPFGNKRTGMANDVMQLESGECSVSGGSVWEKGVIIGIGKELNGLLKVGDELGPLGSKLLSGDVMEKGVK